MTEISTKQQVAVASALRSHISPPPPTSAEESQSFVPFPYDPSLTPETVTELEERGTELRILRFNTVGQIPLLQLEENLCWQSLDKDDSRSRTDSFKSVSAFKRVLLCSENVELCPEPSRRVLPWA